MKIRRDNKLLVEPPTLATGDIAFNLIVFFLVCVSIQPDTGRKQTIPKSEQQPEKKNQSKNIEVAIRKNAVLLAGTPVPLETLEKRIKDLMKTKRNEADKVVVVKSADDTPYEFWVEVTGAIERGDGIVTLELEETQTVTTE